MLKSFRHLDRLIAHVGEFARFAVTGGLGFAIDYAILECLVRGFALNPFFARLIALGVAIFATWAINRSWTFRRHGASEVKATLPAYYLVQFMGGAINYGVFSGALIAIPSLRDALIIPLAAGSLVAMIFNFVFCRQVFKMASLAGISDTTAPKART